MPLKIRNHLNKTIARFDTEYPVKQEDDRNKMVVGSGYIDENYRIYEKTQSNRDIIIQNEMGAT
jgi:hypothetical protein